MLSPICLPSTLWHWRMLQQLTLKQTLEIKPLTGATVVRGWVGGGSLLVCGGGSPTSSVTWVIRKTFEISKLQKKRFRQKKHFDAEPDDERKTFADHSMAANICADKQLCNCCGFCHCKKNRLVCSTQLGLWNLDNVPLLSNPMSSNNAADNLSQK